MITRIENIPLSISIFLEALGNEKEKVATFGGFLAVDAISMRPHVFVRKDGVV